MKKIGLYCLAVFACVSFFLSVSSFAADVNLLENPKKNIYYIFIPGSIQGSFGTLDACYYCHGNGGLGTKIGKDKGVPDFTNAEWQSSKTDSQLVKHLETGGVNGNCTACRGRISENAIASLVGIVRNFAVRK